MAQKRSQITQPPTRSRLATSTTSSWREERQAEVNCLHKIATDEFAIRSVVPLVLYASGHRVTAVHSNGLFEHSPDRTAHVTHVVPPDLSGGVCQTVWVLGTRRIEKDAWRLD